MIIKSMLLTQLLESDTFKNRACYCRVNSAVNVSDLTLKEAVEYLSHPEENYQQCGATFIQHTTFKEDHAKQEVRWHAIIL